MSETLREGPIDGEAPVNPYSLLEAVNSASDATNTGWLLFLGAMSYLLVAVAGVTHKDLFLSADIPLPILQVRIDLTRFFLFAPILLVLFHLGIVAQLVLLARKSLELDRAVRVLEATDRRTHPIRLELHNFFFVQGIAGPERSRVMDVFLHGMTWLTLVILPVVLLLFVQVVFLPYHDAWITSMHRAAVAADILMLVSIGVFLMRPETSFFTALWRTSRYRPLSSSLTVLVMGAVAWFSFFVATIAGEQLDRLGQALFGDRHKGAVSEPRYAIGFVMPFLGATADGTLFGIFQRNLNVADLDLVVDKDVTPGEPSLTLRGRDLRFARLDRADLHQADFTGADLEGASLTGADLRHALLSCADINRWMLSEDRGGARCTNARGANLTRANLREARLAGIDLTGARLEEAQLEGAELAHSLLAGANLYSARLERADLTGGIMLAGANLANASLQGADLTGAHLHGADLRGAGLHGAILAFANLHSALLRGADLEAADLFRAKLLGADLGNARLRAADLRGAAIWLTQPPPGGEAIALADLSDLAIRAPDDQELAAMRSILPRMQWESHAKTVGEMLAPLLSGAGSGAWASSPDRTAWAALVTETQPVVTRETYTTDLTTALTRLMCRSRWATGSVATGVARRALNERFKGQLIAVYERLRSDECAATKSMPALRVFRDLSAAVDLLRDK